MPDFGADGPNPLRDPADRRLPRVPEPCALVIFGIGGDLSRKKLIAGDLRPRQPRPAAHRLRAGRASPAPTGPTAAASSRWPARRAKDDARTAWNEEVWRRLSSNTRFVEGSFSDDSAFDELASVMAELRESHGIQGNAAFYLSIPPKLFPDVLKQMQRTGLADAEQAGGWRRVVVEKPFGHDLPSALELNQLVDTVFPPRDVYRIDHYLGKETVQNLLALRFANQLFEPVWNANYVDSVQITMAEDVGIGGRAAFYQATGAARDVLQNHLLQLLALTAMEEPVEFSPEAVRIEKLKALRAISLPDRPRRRTPCAASTTRAGWPASGPAPSAPRTASPRTPTPRPSPRCGSASRPGAGPACRSTCAPASGCPSGSPRSRCCSRRRRTCRSARPTPRSSGTTSSSSGCSPTRA